MTQQREKSPRVQIEELEKHIVAGDLSGMAESVAELHERWESLSESERHDALKLEAVFLSFMQLKSGVH